MKTLYKDNFLKRQKINIKLLEEHEKFPFGYSNYYE